MWDQALKSISDVLTKESQNLKQQSQQSEKESLFTKSEQLLHESKGVDLAIKKLNEIGQSVLPESKGGYDFVFENGKITNMDKYNYFWSAEEDMLKTDR